MESLSVSHFLQTIVCDMELRNAVRSWLSVGVFLPSLRGNTFSVPTLNGVLPSQLSCAGASYYLPKARS